MTNQEAIKMLTAKVECIRRETSGTDIDCNFRNCDECDLCYKQGTMGDQIEALCVAISALQAQEIKQEVKQEEKKSGCTYRPDCPWYDGSKCNSPNDHGYHECDYDRGIFPESYEELSKNSTELDNENGDLQQTCNQLATEQPVRCKDCKHYGYILYSGTQFEYGKCFGHEESDYTFEVKPDDFCSRAERREE